MRFPSCPIWVTLLAASAFLAGSANAAQNLITNGEFNFDDGLSGWTLLSGSVSTGFIGTNGNPPGSFANRNIDSVAAFLFQPVSATPGSVYTVSFDFQDFGIGNDDFRVSFGNQNLVNGVPNPGSGEFATYTFTGLVSSSNSPFLTFSGFDNDQAWFVDNVFVHEVPGPLPVLGVAAAFGYSRKLRSRLQAAKRTPEA